MLDEGIDRVLDLLQSQAGLNSVMVYTHTYYTADGIRRKRVPAVLAPDHGVPVRDLNTRNLPYVWVRHHDLSADPALNGRLGARLDAHESAAVAH